MATEKQILGKFGEERVVRECLSHGASVAER